MSSVYTAGRGCLEGGAPALGLLAQRFSKADIATARDSSSTLLHAASVAGRTDVIELLVEWGADLHVRDHQGRTPLHAVCFESMFMPVPAHVSAVRTLLSLGADPNALADDYTSLSFCASSPALVGLLLDAGALVKLGCRSILSAAAFGANRECVQLLLRRRGFLHILNWKPPGGVTPMDSVRSRGLLDLPVEKMLQEALVVAEAWDRRAKGVYLALTAADARTSRRLDAAPAP